jgi:hypothetical protein
MHHKSEKNTFYDLLTLEDEGNTLLRLIGNHYPKMQRHIPQGLNPITRPLDNSFKCKAIQSQGQTTVNDEC